MRQGKTESTENVVLYHFELTKALEHRVDDLSEQLTITRTTLDRHLTSVRKDVRFSFSRQGTHVTGERLNEKREKNLWKPNIVFPTNKLKGSLQVRRFDFPTSLAPWAISFPEYTPIEWTYEEVLRWPVWADSNDPREIAFNEISDNINRTTCIGAEGGKLGTITLEPETGRPINPMGRTGMRGRGTLGRCGSELGRRYCFNPLETRRQWCGYRA